MLHAIGSSEREIENDKENGMCCSFAILLVNADGIGAISVLDAVVVLEPESILGH
jgi:hypothetical protein